MAASEPIPGETRIEGELRRARHLLEKREFAAALAAAQSLLAEAPENRDVLYLVAVSQRYSGRIADALKTLARFEKAHPDFGRLFQERGHCYRVGRRDRPRDRGLSPRGELECGAHRELEGARGALPLGGTARGSGKCRAASNAARATPEAGVQRLRHAERGRHPRRRTRYCAAFSRRTAITSKRCACSRRSA